MDHLHLIPSNKEIKSTINGLRQGHKIKIEGIIVNVESIDNYDWDSKTILTNKEEHRKLVVWVESIQVE